MRQSDRYLAATAVVAVLLSLNTVQGAILFTEDFEDINVGASMTAGNSAFTGGVAGGTFTVRDDAAPLLPAGNSNPFTGTRYLDYNDAASRPLLHAPVALANTEFMLSFDYFEPQVLVPEGSSYANTTIVFTDGALSGTNNANRAFQVAFSVADGAIGSIGVAGGEADSSGPSVSVIAGFNANQLNHFDIVANSRSEGRLYKLNGVMQSLAPHTVDVWVNGARLINDGPFRHVPMANINRWGISPPGSGGALQRAYFDNILIASDIGRPIPEPTTCGMAGLAAMALGLAARARRRAG